MTSPAGLLYDPLLKILASQVDDLEELRKASDNRYRQLTRNEPDEDGVTRGLGLPEGHREVLKVRDVIDGIAAAEHQAVLQLQGHMRHGPWAPWLKDAIGVGEKTLARLLAAIGDPYWHPLEQRPRLVSELWSFSGYGDASAQVRRKGQKVNWSGEARKRCYVITDSVIKANKGRYREIYDETKAHYVDAVHVSPCVRCGPAGKPALAGSPLSKGHIDGRGRRAICKEVLRDLWLEARDMYGEGDQAVSVAA